MSLIAVVLLAPTCAAAQSELIRQPSATACQTQAPRKPLRVAALMSITDESTRKLGDLAVKEPAAGRVAPLPAPRAADTNRSEAVKPADSSAPVRGYRPIGSVTLDASLPQGLMPAAQQEPKTPVGDVTPTVDDSRRAGGWVRTTSHWAATNMHHRPLYFEEVNLERYGYTPSRCLQPVISGARFFVTVPALPYLMASQPQRTTCIYTLGHYRPGDCFPYRWVCLLGGCVGAGALAETAAVIGLVALIP